MKPITGKASFSVLLGAAFLMATSSIGPGLMLQTAAFTNELKADFAFAIVISVIFSIIALFQVLFCIFIKILLSFVNSNQSSENEPNRLK